MAAGSQIQGCIHDPEEESQPSLNTALKEEENRQRHKHTPKNINTDTNKYALSGHSVETTHN